MEAESKVEVIGVKLQMFVATRSYLRIVLKWRRVEIWDLEIENRVEEEEEEQ